MSFGKIFLAPGDDHVLLAIDEVEEAALVGASHIAERETIHRDARHVCAPRRASIRKRGRARE